MSPHPHVVVVGLGYAGSEAVKELSRSRLFRITVIDQKSYFLHNIAALRQAVQPGYTGALLSSHQVLSLPHVTFVHATATELRSHAVLLRDQTSISFDYLILATGASSCFPAKTLSPTCEQAAAEYRQLAAQIEQAQHVVLVGGGAVGVELAGEINYAHRHKRITLIHSATRLLDGNSIHSAALSDRLVKLLQQRGVKLLLNDRVTQPAPATDGKPLVGQQLVLTEHGSQLSGDLIIFTVGCRPNSQLIESSPEFSAKQLLNARKQIYVDQYQRLPEYSHIFAVGDVSTFQPGMGVWSMDQGLTVAKHLARVTAGKAGCRPSKGPDVLLVPLGQDGGAASWDMPVIGKPWFLSWFAQRFKGRDLRVNKLRKSLLLA